MTQPAPCKQCRKPPILIRARGPRLRIRCESPGCDLMFLIQQDDNTEDQAIKAWNNWMAEFAMTESR